MNAMSKMVQLSIEVHIDVLCPWSYMQKRALEGAMERFRRDQPDAVFDVVWRPYYIHACLQAGIDKPALYTGNAASRDRWDRLTLAGSQYGIRFRCHGTTGPSRDAHKLMLLAMWECGPSAQTRVLTDLFRGHFEEGRDITDHDWLVEVGRAAGLAAEVVAAAVACPNMGRAVDEAVRGAMAAAAAAKTPAEGVAGSEGGEGIVAVPCVTVRVASATAGMSPGPGPGTAGKRYRMGGFQHGATLEDVFRKAYTEGAAGPKLPPYQVLVDGMPASGQV